MNFTLRQPQIFPDGTTVGAYLDSAFPGGAPEPLGSAVSSGTVADDAVTLTGLTSGQRYRAAGTVGGIWHYVQFIPGADSNEPDVTGAITAETDRASAAEAALDARLDDVEEIVPSPIRSEMQVVGWNRDYEKVLIANAEIQAHGFTWATNASICEWRDKLWVIFDGNTHGGTTEAATGQKIHLSTSDDEGASWDYIGEVFNDAALTSTPVTNSNANWFQPNFFKPDGDDGPLCVLWSQSGVLMLSQLASDGALWTTQRFTWSGMAPTLATDVNGSGGTLAALDAITDYYPFAPSNPLVLETGKILAPLTFSSVATEDAAASGELSAFLRATKFNAVMWSDDGGASWEVGDRIPIGAAMTDASNWEPFLWQAKDGTLCCGTRNMRSVMPDASAQCVAFSEDLGRSFTLYRPTELLVSAQRTHVVHDDERYLMPLNHHTADAAAYASNNGLLSRINGAIGFSRTGLDDFVLGLPYTDLLHRVDYPQMLVRTDDDGKRYAYVTYAETGLLNSSGGQTIDGQTRRSLALAKIEIPTAAATAYAFKTQRSEMAPAHGPVVVDAPLDYLEFEPFATRTTGAAFNPGSSFTLFWGGRLISGLMLTELRGGSPLAGCVLRSDGLSLATGVTLSHGISVPANCDLFIGVTLDISTGTVVFYVSVNGGAYQTATRFLRAVSFAGQPSDAETVTVDGTVLTFKSMSPGANEVLIGASATATATNLAAAIAALTGKTAWALGTDVFIARSDGATFVVSELATNVSVPASIPNFFTASTLPVFGKSPLTTAITQGSYRLYGARGYASALTAANLKAIFNEYAAALGYATMASPTTPGAATYSLTPASSTSDFPDIADKPYGKVTTLNAGTAVINGEGSIALESPYPSSRRTVAYRLGALASGADKYVIATIGTGAFARRVYIDGAAPNTLKLESDINFRTIATIADPTRTNQVVITTEPGAVTVGTVKLEMPGPGIPRVYLGNAFPQGLLAYAKTTTFDLSQMVVAEYRNAQELADETLSAIVSTITGLPAISVRRKLEAFLRFVITDEGRMRWSFDGLGVPTINLRAAGAHQMLLDAEWKVTRPLATDVAFTALVDGDTNSRSATDAAGKRYLGPGNGAADIVEERVAAGRHQNSAHYRALLGLGTMEINATGLSSAQIDALWASPPPNGTVVSDPTNNWLLKRDSGGWRKSTVWAAV